MLSVAGHAGWVAVLTEQRGALWLLMAKLELSQGFQSWLTLPWPWGQSYH